MTSHHLAAVLFTGNVRSTAGFYEKVVGTGIRRVEDDHIVLNGDSFRLIVHRIREIAASLGGCIYGSDREWNYETDTVCDGYDPDGNVFQIFQRP